MTISDLRDLLSTALDDGHMSFDAPVLVARVDEWPLTVQSVQMINAVVTECFTEDDENTNTVYLLVDGES